LSRWPLHRAATPAIVVVLLMFGLALPSSASSGGGTYVIRGDKSAGGIRIGSSTAAQVQRLFGKPSTTRVLSLEACTKSWRRVQLQVHFFSFRGDPCLRRVALIVTVTGRAAWRTGAGLRVGDSVQRVRDLYPRARLRSRFRGESGYWLVTRQVCAEAGGGAYPGLLARMRNGRVSALVSRLAVCDIE
jgi:hypothetical protein